MAIENPLEMQGFDVKHLAIFWIFFWIDVDCALRMA